MAFFILNLMKKCSKCKEIKPFSEFKNKTRVYKDKVIPYYNSHCSPCERKLAEIYRRRLGKSKRFTKEDHKIIKEENGTIKKQCTKCFIMKPLSEFHNISKSRKSNLRTTIFNKENHCRKCNVEQNRIFYYKNLLYMREKCKNERKEYYSKNRDIISNRANVKSKEETLNLTDGYIKRHIAKKFQIKIKDIKEIVNIPNLIAVEKSRLKLIRKLRKP